MAKFELVQRLTDAPDNRPRNVMGDYPSIIVSKILLDAGAKVDLDYMGASEYSERRTLIGSANRIASKASRLKIVTRHLVLPNQTDEDVRFVCTEEQEALLLPQWDEWVKDPHTREPSAYPRDNEGCFGDIVGWWALKEDLIWSRREDVADNIRNAFTVVAANAAK